MTARTAIGSRPAGQVLVFSSCRMVPAVISWKKLDRDAWVIASRTGAGISRSWAVMNGIAPLGAARRARRLPASHRLRTLAAAVQALFPSITRRSGGEGVGGV